MIKDYVNEKNLQVAMTEYDSEMDLDHVVKTQSGDQIGTVTQVYDNTGHITLPPGVKELESLTGSVTGRTMETVSGDGEQVYAVVKNPYDNAEDVEKSYAIL